MENRSKSGLLFPLCAVALACGLAASNAFAAGPGNTTTDPFILPDDGTQIAALNTGTGDVSVDIDVDGILQSQDTTISAQVWTSAIPDDPNTTEDESVPAEPVSVPINFSPGVSPPIIIGPGQEVWISDDANDTDSKSASGTITTNPS